AEPGQNQARILSRAPELGEMLSDCETGLDETLALDPDPAALHTLAGAELGDERHRFCFWHCTLLSYGNRSSRKIKLPRRAPVNAPRTRSPAASEASFAQASPWLA